MYTATDLDVVDAVAAVAATRGLPQAQIALAWLLTNQAVCSPIVGATKPYQLDDAIAATDVHLDDHALAKLEAPYRPHAILGHL